MSVFTTVTPEQLSAWLGRYAIGPLTQLEGIAAGIENTNYFVTTTQGRYVLTLFEKLQSGELQFYFSLMSHLAHHGIPCPQPVATLDHEFLGELNGKPAGIVTCLPGTDLKDVNTGHCATLGALLAQMHLAGARYDAQMVNPRGALWWQSALPKVLPFMEPDAAALLTQEVRFQALCRFDNLPRGVIHADLFRENVLWTGTRVGGIIDFYFACRDTLLYDVAIAVNDWCTSNDGTIDLARARALLDAYRGVRPLNERECAAWPALLRAGALRFWVSRLYDLHLPRPGLITHAKDPRTFQRVLEHHIERAAELKAVCA